MGQPSVVDLLQFAKHVKMARKVEEERCFHNSEWASQIPINIAISSLRQPVNGKTRMVSRRHVGDREVAITGVGYMHGFRQATGFHTVTASSLSVYQRSTYTSRIE